MAFDISQLAGVDVQEKRRVHGLGLREHIAGLCMHTPYPDANNVKLLNLSLTGREGDVEPV